MTFQEILKIAGLILGSLGGGAFIVVSLSSWLGNLWARRILQNKKANSDVHLASIRHELGIAKSAYEHHLDLILEYYATFYRHYRLCQRTAHADAYRKLPEGELKHSRDEFLDALDGFLADWAAQEGKIRLLLPAKLLETHEEAVVAFNEFKRSVQAFSSAEPYPREKAKVFNKIDGIKVKLEAGLREFLRTESLLK